jgi:hypothetical protein
MPQNFPLPASLHRVITCAANDLVTVNLSGGRVAIKNDGPGNVWFSFDLNAPAVGLANGFVLHAGETFFEDRLGYSMFNQGAVGQPWLRFVSDAAATIVNVLT